jgi:hypothetical protein
MRRLSDLSAPSTGRLRGLAGIFALSLLLGAWMDLSAIHRFHDGDSVVPVLMSLVRWRPFYWEQSRFGMLVPLLALPVEGPYHNLLFQVALRLAAVVASFFLLARAVLPRPYWPAAGAAALALFVAGRGLWFHCYFQMQPYGQAVALSLTGIALLDLRGRRGGLSPLAVAAGAVCLLLAFWVSLSMVFWLMAFLGLRKVLGLAPGAAGWRFSLREALPFALVGLSFAASVLAARYAEWRNTALGPAAAAKWPHAWASLGVRGAGLLSLPLVAATALVLAGAGAAFLVRRPARARLAASAGLCLLATALAEIAALGTSAWVHMNVLSLRFISCSLLAAVMALPVMAAVLLLEGRERWHRPANAAALLLLMAAVAWRFGPPSPAAARAAFDALWGAEARQVADSGATHVLGSYWRVWPVVLHADQLLWERGERRRVWGITARSRPTRDLWWRRSWSAARVATIGDDSAVGNAMGSFRLPPLFLAETRPAGVRIYTGAPPPSGASGADVVSFPPLVRVLSVASDPPAQEPRR